MQILAEMKRSPRPRRDVERNWQEAYRKTPLEFEMRETAALLRERRVADSTWCGYDTNITTPAADVKRLGGNFEHRVSPVENGDLMQDVRYQISNWIRWLLSSVGPEAARLSAGTAPRNPKPRPPNEPSAIRPRQSPISNPIGNPKRAIRSPRCRFLPQLLFGEQPIPTAESWQRIPLIL